MKLHFLVTLNISGISDQEELNEEAVADYARVIKSAIKMQNDFAGLTPDHLSEIGVGVDDFTVKPTMPLLLRT